MARILLGGMSLFCAGLAIWWVGSLAGRVDPGKLVFARTVLSAPGGWVADHTDWVTFFVLTTVAAVPGLLLWFWLQRRGFVPRAHAPPATG